MSDTKVRSESIIHRPRLHGHMAFVTGGTRGSGAAISRSLAEQGATVAAGYSSNRESAEKFAAELEEAGGHGSVHQGNVGSSEDCRLCGTRQE